MIRPVQYLCVAAALVACVELLCGSAIAAQPAFSKIAQTLEAPPPNYTLVGKVQEGALAHGRSARISIPIETDGCYRIAAISDDTAQDISLVIYQSGVEKARDRLSGKRPSVDWCAAMGGDVEAEIQMFSGEGIFAVAVYEKKPAPSPTPKMKAAGGSEKDFIANRIRQLALHFAYGRTSISEVLRANILEGAHESIPITLRGKCITIIGAAAPTLLETELRLVGTDGRALPARLQATESYTTLVPETCPPAGKYILEVTVKKGHGSFGLQVFSD